MGGKKNCLPILDRVKIQGEEEFEKSEIHFGRVGSALPAD